MKLSKKNLNIEPYSINEIEQDLNLDKIHVKKAYT